MSPSGCAALQDGTSLFQWAYTTFSTFILETSNLLKDGEVTRALMNILASVVIGFVLFRLGALVGRLI